MRFRISQALVGYDRLSLFPRYLDLIASGVGMQLRSKFVRPSAMGAMWELLGSSTPVLSPGLRIPQFDTQS